MANNKCIKFCEVVWEWCLVIPISILLCIAIVVVPILVSPLLLFRWCVKKCARWFKPDLANIAACGNCLMLSYDQVYGRNDNTTVIALKVLGNLDLDLVRLTTTEKIINAKTNQGTLKFPELQQFPVKWVGYYFWKPESNFHVEDHVVYYASPKEGKFYSDEEAAVVEAELVTKAHSKEKSPWQIIILPNVKSSPEDSPNSMLYFRTHHGLMDGFALLNILFVILGGLHPSKIGIVEHNSSCGNQMRKFAYYCTHMLKLPFHMARGILPTLGSGYNDFRLDFKDLAREQIGTTPLRIPLNHLKEIRKIQGVDLVSIIIASLIGGLRRTMLDLNMKIPKYVHFGYPWPIPGHEGNLRVHASAATLSFPIGIKDPVERLKAIDKYMKYIKTSSYTQGIFLLKPIFGSLPAVLIDASIPRIPPTGAMNIFACPSESISVYGKEVAELHFSYGQQKFRSSILFSSCSYGGTVAIKIAVNKNIFSEQSKVYKINQFALEELDILNKQSVV